jgi:anti-anti-sigma factor
MQITLDKKDNTARMRLNGRFDFNSHREFRGACDQVLQDKNNQEIEVDFSSVDYLDSSALGMLLLLREKASNVNMKVSLLNCKGIVQQVLEVANFQKLFSIR